MFIFSRESVQQTLELFLAFLSIAVLNNLHTYVRVYRYCITVSVTIRAKTNSKKLLRTSIKTYSACGNRNRSVMLLPAADCAIFLCSTRGTGTGRRYLPLRSVRRPEQFISVRQRGGYRLAGIPDGRSKRADRSQNHSLAAAAGVGVARMFRDQDIPM